MRISKTLPAVSTFATSMLARLGAIALAAAVALPVAAQNFPNRPIRIIVPYGAAGAVDFAPRVLAEKLTIELGQPVVVENKSGGLGIPAINDTLNQPADGHVILAADAGHWAITPALQTVSYDFMRDFTPVTMIFTNGLIFFTSSTSGINSLQDFIAQAKARPGQLNYATPGIGSPHHLAIESLKSQLGLDIKHVPYRGGAEMVESVLRGDTQISLVSLGAVLPMAKAGKVKMLAVSITKRLKQTPDVPTVAEVTGLSEYNFPGQQAVVVRAGTPQAVVEKLSAAIRKVSLQPEVFNKVLETTASELTPTTPEQTAEFIRGDIKKYTNAVKVSGAKVQ